MFFKRGELETLSLQEYRLWRSHNESLLGSAVDPDSSKYLLAPPNLFTGEYLYFGFEVLMALKKETLIDHIRDHFCGYSTNLTYPGVQSVSDAQNSMPSKKQHWIL